MLARATRSLAPAHAACARRMHSTARLLASRVASAASAAAAVAFPLRPSTAALSARRFATLTPSHLSSGESPLASRIRQLEAELAFARSQQESSGAEPRVSSGGESRMSRFRRVLDARLDGPRPLAVLAAIMLTLYFAITGSLNPSADEVRFEAGLELRLMEWKREEARKRARKTGQQLSPEEEAEWEQAIEAMRKRDRIARRDYFGLYPIYIKHFGTDTQKQEEAALAQRSKSDPASLASVFSVDTIPSSVVHEPYIRLRSRLTRAH